MTSKVEFETLYYEVVADGVVLLTLNRPANGNAVVPQLVDDLLQALGDIDKDFSHRCVVLTGAGKVFCAGADLPGMKEYLDTRLRVEQEPYNARILMPLTPRIATSRLPFIAAINGAATAGGLDLAMACDIRFASRNAKLGETYVKVGLAPGNGGAYFLPRIVGPGMAAELALTGDLIDAERALAIGLVNRVCEPAQLIPEAVALAAKIASRPRRAVDATKQALRNSWHTDLPGALSTGLWTTAALQYSDDFREGVESTMEKRDANFNKKR